MDKLMTISNAAIQIYKHADNAANSKQCCTLHKEIYILLGKNNQWSAVMELQ